MMGWQNEFPDFPATGIPDLPSYWSDSSWRNDICPSFAFLEAQDGDTNFTLARVWIDYPDPESREFSGMPRYCVTFEDGRGDVFSARESDSWLEIKIYCDQIRALSDCYRRLVGHCPFLDDPRGASVQSVMERIAARVNYAKQESN